MKSFFDLNYAVVGAESEAIKRCSTFAGLEEQFERFGDMESPFECRDPLEILIALEDMDEEFE